MAKSEKEQMKELIYSYFKRLDSFSLVKTAKTTAQGLFLMRDRSSFLRFD